MFKISCPLNYNLILIKIKIYGTFLVKAQQLAGDSHHHVAVPLLLFVVLQEEICRDVCQGAVMRADSWYLQESRHGDGHIFPVNDGVCQLAVVNPHGVCQLAVVNRHGICLRLMAAEVSDGVWGVAMASHGKMNICHQICALQNI